MHNLHKRASQHAFHFSSFFLKKTRNRWFLGAKRTDHSEKRTICKLLLTNAAKPVYAALMQRRCCKNATASKNDALKEKKGKEIKRKEKKEPMMLVHHRFAQVQVFS